MRFIFLLAMLLSLQVVQAQEYVVKGHIYDLQNHNPIIGSVVKIVGTDVYTISDQRGYFEIKSKEQSGELHISMLGYKSQTITYTDEKELYVQLTTDAQALGEVVISAFGDKTNKETAGAVSVLDGKSLKQGSGVSLQTSFNSVPGVKLDQSSLGESRISIRGSGIRAGWGIRNVKIYVNEIPLTEADGTSRLEGIDINNLGWAEIIRGPASSIYGSGTGGVVNFNLERAEYQEHSLESSGLIGSFGLKRSALTYRSSSDKMNSYVSYGWQQYDGYREHSFDKRNFLAANFQIFPSEKQLVTVLINRTSQDTEIPGALTQSQMEQDRKQASPTNLDKKAGRVQNWTRIGLGHKYWFDENFSNATSLYTYFYDLNHPLAYAYIRNYYQSIGGRTKFDYKADFSVLPTKFIFGAEFNQANSKGTQYVNNQGKEGDINSNVDYKDIVYSLFLQTESTLWKDATLTLGLSYNSTNYDFTDYLNPEKSGIKDFKAQVTPRIALSHNFVSYLSLHGSISTGFYAPTHSEIQNANGTINEQLQSQEATNYEINAKGSLFDSRFAYDLALFSMDMTGELIGQTVSQGVTIYHNSGKTKHTGIELAMNYLPIAIGEHGFITELKMSTAVSYSHFTFKDYKVLGEDNSIVTDYSGNKLTGIAPWTASAGIDMETIPGFYANLNYYFNDQFPLNDLNSDYNKAYHVLNAKMGYRQIVLKQLELHGYVGVDNITNSKYSSLTALNATGFNGAQPAYFNPSPTTNMYVGLGVKYLL